MLTYKELKSFSVQSSSVQLLPFPAAAMLSLHISSESRTEPRLCYEERFDFLRFDRDDVFLHNFWNVKYCLNTNSCSKTKGSSVCSWRDQIRSIIMSVVISALDSEILWKNVKNSCKSLSEPEVIESLLPTLNLDWNVWDAEKSGITSCHLYKWQEFKRQVAE